MTVDFNPSIQSIAVTGALGNLGTKLLHHLSRRSTIQKLIGLDLRAASAEQTAALPAVEFIACDLADWHDRRWRDVLAHVDAVVHFAAQNPYPQGYSQYSISDRVPFSETGDNSHLLSPLDGIVNQLN